MATTPVTALRTVLAAALQQQQVLTQMLQHFGTPTAFLEWSSTRAGDATLQQLANDVLAYTPSTATIAEVPPVALHATIQELMLIGEAFHRLEQLEQAVANA